MFQSQWETIAWIQGTPERELRPRSTAHTSPHAACYLLNSDGWAWSTFPPPIDLKLDTILIWHTRSQSMRRDHVRLSQLVHVFLDLDAAGGGRCWTSTDMQIYRYVVWQNYSVWSADAFGGLLAHVRGLIDAVLGLATTVLPLQAWIVSATSLSGTWYSN